VNVSVLAAAPFQLPVTMGGGITVATADTDPTKLVAVNVTVQAYPLPAVGAVKVAKGLAVEIPGKVCVPEPLYTVADVVTPNPVPPDHASVKPVDVTAVTAPIVIGVGGDRSTIDPWSKG